MKARRVKAEIALRGIRADVDGTACLFSWDRVARLPGGPVWSAWDEDGRTVMSGNRRLLLRLYESSDRILAYKAQGRFFRNAWRAGTLYLIERAPREEPEWGYYVFAAVATIAGLTFPIWAGAPLDILWPGWIGSLICFLSAAQFLWLGIEVRRSHRLSTIVLDMRGLHLTDRDGRSNLTPWRELVGERWFTRSMPPLRMPDGSGCRLFGASRRLTRAMWVVAEELFPEAAARHAWTRLPWFRLAALSTTGALLVGGAALWLQPDRPMFALRAALATLGLAASLILAYRFLLWKHTSKRVMRWERAARRRRAKR